MIDTLNPVYGGQKDGEVHINFMLIQKIIKGIKDHLKGNKEIYLNYYLSESLDTSGDIIWLGNVKLDKALKRAKKRSKRNEEVYEVNATLLPNKSKVVETLNNQEDSDYIYWLGDFVAEKSLATDELTNTLYDRIVNHATARN
jgi:hypothetical protein